MTQVRGSDGHRAELYSASVRARIAEPWVLLLLDSPL